MTVLISRLRSIIRLLSVLPIVTIGLGCSSTSARGPKFIEDIRPIPPAMKVTSFTIQRRDLQDALVSMGESPIRLVPVYQTVSAIESFEYRIFDIKGGDVYSLLGLENSDIIVAVNRFLIKNPAQFPAFVQLLGNENDAAIEIRRAGQARLMRYTFVPPMK